MDAVETISRIKEQLESLLAAPDEKGQLTVVCACLTMLRSVIS
jgi:hypothetical protein